MFIHPAGGKEKKKKIDMLAGGARRWQALLALSGTGGNISRDGDVWRRHKKMRLARVTINFRAAVHVG